MNKMKENQKALKSVYETEIKKIYAKDSKMVEWCVNRAKYIFQMRGKVIAFEKRTIDKDFWFGYSDLGQGLSYEENNARVKHNQENVVAFFINSNLSDLNKIIDSIKDVLKK